MATGKWIGGFLGFVSGGPLGALAGFALGWLFDKGLDSVNAKNDGGWQSYSGDTYSNSHDYSSRTYSRQRDYEGQRNSFLFSLLVLSSYIIKADGKVMHSEMETVRNFLRHNFGESAVVQGQEIMMRLFEQQKQMGNKVFANTIREACMQIANNMEYSQRLQLFSFLATIAKADGNVAQSEVDALNIIAQNIGISASDAESILNLGRADNLESAYKILGIPPTATDDEVKAAYRRMALQHHPDRVATLGEDVRRADEKKFQEINEAKEVIYKARGL